MNKLSVLIKFYFSIFFFSILINSCCSEPTKVTIAGIADLFFMSTQNGIPQIRDTIQGEDFFISVNLDLEFVEVFENPLMPTAYGWSCPEELQNALIKESLVLSCDQEFTYEDIVIDPGTDFSQFEELDIVVSGQDCFVSFNGSFLSKANFMRGPHVFTVELMTDDDLNLISSGDIFFDI